MNLNFGCREKTIPGYFNVHYLNAKNVDLVFDFDRFPYPLKGNYSHIEMYEILEHVENPILVLKELHKHCFHKTKLKIAVPYYNCAGAYNAWSHKHFFNRKAVEMMIDRNLFRIVKLKLIPTRLGRLIPGFIREKASFVLGEIYSQIEVELEARF
ncbi:MAG: hypothetical protein AABW88_02375 [Nanoarchaeota archaeon]